MIKLNSLFTNELSSTANGELHRILLQRVDPLLGSDLETNNETTSAAR
jgi:hypothetical protein